MGYQDNSMNDPGAMMMMGGGGGSMLPGMGPGFGGMGPGFPGPGPMEGQDFMQGGPMGQEMGPMMGPMMGPPMGPPMGGPMGMGEMGMGDMSGSGPRKPVLHFADFTLFPPTVRKYWLLHLSVSDFH